jgi:hypothetical protein
MGQPQGVELSNLAADTLDDALAAAERGIQRIRDTHHLAFSFLRHCACRCGDHVTWETKALADPVDQPEEVIAIEAAA